MNQCTNVKAEYWNKMKFVSPKFLSYYTYQDNWSPYCNDNTYIMSLCSSYRM